MADAAHRDDRTPHILVVPYPAQGHISPMLQFSKRLRKKGVKISLVTTKFIARTSHSIPSSFPVLTISDGHDDGGIDSAESIQIYLDSLRRFGSESLRELLQQLSSSASPADCVIYDGFNAWAQDVANEFKVIKAVFFTQSCAVADIYYHVYKGLIKLPLPDTEIEIPGLPPMKPPEFPSFIYQLGSYPAYYDVIVNQYANVHKADLIFWNTFYELEREVLDCLKRIWPAIRPVGPSIPSGFLDGRIENDREYGLSFFNADGDVSLKWLDDRRKGSVVFVSFGSFAEVPVEQMEETADCLKNCKWPFLWVVRTSEAAKLPTGFIAETAEKGLVVSWCRQLEVLAHEAIGCFVTHCGWNSTLEAVSLGVPMVAVPRWTDQNTNAKFISDVWKVGLKASAHKDGLVKREALLQCIEEVIVPIYTPPVYTPKPSSSVYTPPVYTPEPSSTPEYTPKPPSSVYTPPPYTPIVPSSSVYTPPYTPIVPSSSVYTPPPYTPIVPSSVYTPPPYTPIVPSSSVYTPPPYTPIPPPSYTPKPPPSYTPKPPPSYTPKPPPSYTPKPPPSYTPKPPPSYTPKPPPSYTPKPPPSYTPKPPPSYTPVPPSNTTTHVPPPYTPVPPPSYTPKPPPSYTPKPPPSYTPVPPPSYTPVPPPSYTPVPPPVYNTTTVPAPPVYPTTKPVPPPYANTTVTSYPVTTYSTISESKTTIITSTIPITYTKPVPPPYSSVPPAPYPSAPAPSVSVPPAPYPTVPVVPSAPAPGESTPVVPAPSGTTPPAAPPASSETPPAQFPGSGNAVVPGLVAVFVGVVGAVVV